MAAVVEEALGLGEALGGVGEGHGLAPGGADVKVERQKERQEQEGRQGEPQRTQVSLSARGAGRLLRFGRVPGVGLARGDEAKVHGAQLDDVAGLQQIIVFFAAVDLDAVDAVEVGDGPAVVVAVHAGVGP